MQLVDALMRADFTQVAFLLEDGADDNVKDETGQTADGAAYYSSKKIVELLVVDGSHYC